MGQEKEKDDLRVEDRRYFDQEGNPIRPEEREETSAPAEEKPSQRQKRQTGSPPPPKIDFTSLIFIYVQTALVHLGELEEPVQGKIVENLDGARQVIDIIELLQEKTKGNLTKHEVEYIEGVLFDLRLRYVQKAKKS